MFIPKWVLIPMGFLIFVINYSEAKMGLVAILHDLGVVP